MKQRDIAYYLRIKTDGEFTTMQLESLIKNLIELEAEYIKKALHTPMDFMLNKAKILAHKHNYTADTRPKTKEPPPSETVLTAGSNELQTSV